MEITLGFNQGRSPGSSHGELTREAYPGSITGEVNRGAHPGSSLGVLTRGDHPGSSLESTPDREEYNRKLTLRAHSGVTPGELTGISLGSSGEKHTRGANPGS